MVDFEKDDVRGSVESLKRNLDSFIEMAILLAKLRKAAYDANIEVGFDEKQALELCTSLEL